MGVDFGTKNMSDYSKILKREIGKEETDDKKKDSDIKTDPKKEPAKEILEKQTDLFDSSKTSRRAAKKRKDEASDEQIWLSLTDAAKIGGIQAKTLRRAIKSGKIKYEVIHNRYLVDFESLIFYLVSNNKLKNKFKEFGIGKYINTWKIGYRL